MAGRSRSKRPRAPPPPAAAPAGGPGNDALACGTSKRPRTATSTVGVGDLISGLGDDVLLRVIQLMPDARDAVRTGALSRRWRGLWTRVPALRFASTFRRPAGNDDDVRRYAAFVDAALALRAAQTAEHAIEHLGISFSVNNDDGDATRGLDLGRAVEQSDHIVTTSLIRDARRWIRYAARHAVKSFVLELPLLLTFGTRYVWQCKKKMKNRLVNLDGLLPSSSKLEAMRLAVHGAVVQLPATGVFTSLTDLSLERMRVEDGDGGNLLARLVSSACCPRLQKLRLIDLDLELPGLKLECGVLSELSLKNIGQLQSLELRTPSLRALNMDGPYSYDLKALTLSAPRLEELTVSNLPYLKVYSHGDLPCVANLKIDLWSHDDGYPDYDDMNATSFYLIQRCRFTKCLVVRLEIPQIEEAIVDMITDRVPQLPHVTSLTLHVSIRERHSFGAGVAILLVRCSNLRYLSMHVVVDSPILKQENDTGLDFLCEHPYHWTTSLNTSSSLQQLQEIELRGLTGTGCEIRFIQFMLISAIKLRKAAISFNPKYWWLKNMRDVFEPMLMASDARWRACSGDLLSYEWYEWRPYIFHSCLDDRSVKNCA